MSLELSTDCNYDAPTLSLNLTMQSACCPPIPAAIVMPSESSTDSLIRVKSEHFTSATEWDGVNGESVVLAATDKLKVFDNNFNRYMDEGTEWERTATGINILVPDFDTTSQDQTLYIHINKTV